MIDPNHATTVQHTVAFRLNDGVDQAAFLTACQGLAVIDGVVDFEVLEQVGAKASYTHALSMWFVDQAAYDHYNDHPDHQHFVHNVWLPQVAEFVELDYQRHGRNR